MNRFYYRDILEEYLLPSIKKLQFGKELAFTYDNDPKRTSGLIKDWLKEKKIQILLCVSFSPALNLNERLWDELEH